MIMGSMSKDYPGRQAAYTASSAASNISKKLSKSYNAATVRG